MPARLTLKPFAEFTPKEKDLVDGYCNPDSKTYRNKVQSYKAAGYYVGTPPEGVPNDGRAMRAAGVQSQKIFKRPHIQAEIELRSRLEYEALKMSVEETVARVSRIARADLMDYLTEVPSACPHCEGEIAHGVEYTFDIERMKKDGFGSLLKDMMPTKYGTKVTFYPADAAQERMMKHHGALKEEKSTTTNTYVDKLLVLAKEG